MSTLCCRISGGLTYITQLYYQLLPTMELNVLEFGPGALNYCSLDPFELFLQSILQYACITLDTALHKLSRREELRKKIQVKIIGI